MSGTLAIFIYPHLVYLSLMIPAFLKPFEADIKKLKLPVVRITPALVPPGYALPLTASKFAGNPYWPANLPYPVSKFGKPLTLLAQINFTEMPAIKGYPRKGIFQVFISHMFWGYGDEYNAYVYHKNIHEDYLTDFSFIEPELYEGLPVIGEHALTFLKDIEYGRPDDFRCRIDFGGVSFDDFRDDLINKHLDVFDKMFTNGDNKIGGYAFLLQGDPREENQERQTDVLLLQIGPDNENIGFCDGGFCSFFINPEDLKRKDFSKVYMNLDCG